MELPINQIVQGDVIEVLRTLPSESIDCIITSPPYFGLRDYGIEGQVGLEDTIEEYLDKMLAITAECRRVLKKTGTMFWNHGDCYGGIMQSNWTSKNPEIARKYQKNASQPNSFMQGKKKGYEKSLLLQAHRLVIRMCDEQQWILRNTLIWWKPNSMPTSVIDRFNVDYEPIFFFTKNKKYFFNQQLEDSIWARHDKRFIKGPSQGGKAVSGNYAINKGGAFRDDAKRNMRSVWYIPTKSYSEAHFATFPQELCEIPIKAGCPENGIVLDPFMGSGTTAFVAKLLNRNYIGIELNPEYIKLAKDRLAQQKLL